MSPAARRALFALVALAACSRPPADDHDDHHTGAATSSALAPPVASATDTNGERPSPLVAMDALAPGGESACTFGHRGVLIDLGDATGRARLVPSDRKGRIDAIERDGATWARVLSRGASLSFVATADDVASATADGATPVIEARVRGGAARSVAVFLNGKAAGTWPLVKGEAHAVSLKIPTALPSSATAPSTAPQIVAGTNELLLRFRGAARGGASALDEEAELDWIHVGGRLPQVVATEDTDYAAPTRADSISSVTLAGAVMRAASVRAPGYERCIGWLPAGGHLVGSVGVAAPANGGEADVEIRAVRDRAPPMVLASMHLAGNAPWKPFDLALDKAMPAGAPRGTLGAIELVATRASKGVRVAFGEPRVVLAPPPTPPVIPRARGVVVVVLGNVAPRSIDLYSSSADATKMPELDALAKTGVTFDANRSTCGAGSCALASMLTALPARAHAVIDDEAGLAPDVTTLGDVARQAGIRAAMFTSNPTTSGAFGFARAWDTFGAHPPDFADPPGAALASFDDAAKWITENAQGGSSDAPRFLVVVHERGGHPPWDPKADDMKSLAPADYTGSLDPKTAAELLARARPRGDPFRGDAPGPRASTMHLTDADRARAWALYSLALRYTDAALGRLLAALKAAGRDADTLVVVTGDVGLGEARAPLEDADSLDEASLATPLVMRLPHGDSDAPLAGRRTSAPTTSVDVARTVVEAFGLAPPASFADAQDLALVASGAADPRGRPSLAADGSHLALAWGSFVLRGWASETALDVTKLCDRTLEPACTSDVRGAFPLALLALQRELSSRVTPPHPLVPVVEPTPLRAALKLWGL